MDIKEVERHIDIAKVCKCEVCDGLVKPDIVFFGENLPEKFFRLYRTDFAKCDLLIIMGTSLVVHPFAGLIGIFKAYYCILDIYEVCTFTV